VIRLLECVSPTLSTAPQAPGTELVATVFADMSRLLDLRLPARIRARRQAHGPQKGAGVIWPRPPGAGLRSGREARAVWRAARLPFLGFVPPVRRRPPARPSRWTRTATRSAASQGAVSRARCTSCADRCSRTGERGQFADEFVADRARALLRAGHTARVPLGGDAATCPERLSVLVHVAAPRPRMLIFGAVDFAAALSQAGRFLGYRVTVCDPAPSSPPRPRRLGCVRRSAWTSARAPRRRRRSPSPRRSSPTPTGRVACHFLGAAARIHGPTAHNSVMGGPSTKSNRHVARQRVTDRGPRLLASWVTRPAPARSFRRLSGLVLPHRHVCR
jgi:hypothetical protein